MCAIDDCDPADIYVAWTLKARKAHRCDECGRQIIPGEKYDRAKMLGEGYWSEFVTCAHCVVAEQWLQINCGGFLHTGVTEDIDEHISEYWRITDMAFGLSRLKFGMGRQWRGFRAPLLPVPHLPRPIKTADFSGQPDALQPNGSSS